MAILPRVIYKFNAIPINDLLHRTGKNYLKLHMEPKESLKAKTVLSKKNKAGGITLPSFKLYYKATVN